MAGPYGESVASLGWLRFDQRTYSDAGVTLVADGDGIAQTNSSDANVLSWTQTTAGDRPKFRLKSDINGLPCAQFLNIDDTTAHTIGLDAPAGLVADKQGFTIWSVGRGLVGRGGGSQNGSALVYWNPVLLYAQQALLGINISGGDFAPAQKSTLSDNVMVIGVRGNATNLTWFIDGVTYTSAALSAGAITGGTVGNAVDLFGLIGELYEQLFFAAQSDPDFAITGAALMAKYHYTPPTAQLIVGVESNVTGMSGNTADVYGRSITSQLVGRGFVKPTLKTINMGISGHTIDQAKNEFAAKVFPLLNTTLFGQKRNFYMATGLLNDILGGASVATAQTSLTALGQNARNDGFVVIWNQPLPIGAGNPYSVGPTAIANFNTASAWANANYGIFADLFIPLPATLLDPNDTTYFQTDKTHLNPVGEREWARSVASTINKAMGVSMKQAVVFASTSVPASTLQLIGSAATLTEDPTSMLLEVTNSHTVASATVSFTYKVVSGGAEYPLPARAVNGSLTIGPNGARAVVQTEIPHGVYSVQMYARTDGAIAGNVSATGSFSAL